MEFEFALEGPPVSLNARDGSPRARKRYQRWKETIREEARKSWPSQEPSRDNQVAVEIRVFYTEIPPDVDNIIKPILDGLQQVAFIDDRQVWHVVSQRIALTTTLEDPSTILTAALEKFDEVVQIKVSYQEEK